MVGLIKAWSFSRWAQYEECPFKAKCKFVDKMKEPPSPAMERGIAIHKKAEDYLSGKLSRLPKELKLLGKEYRAMKKLKPKVEQMWALDSRWRKTDWFDWNNAWLRIKMDAEALENPETLLVDDTKTGKPRGGYGAQLSLYALGGFLFYPEVETIKTRLLFTDHGPDATVEQEYKRKDMLSLKKDWTKKTKAMLNDKRFSPKPGFYCQWCPFSKSKGGPCKF